MEFSRHEYWSRLPFPSPRDLPDPAIESGSPALQADSLSSEPPGKWNYFIKFSTQWDIFPPSFSSLSSHQDSEWVDFKNDPDSESRLCFLTLKLNHLSSSQFLKKLGFWIRNSLYVSMSRASVTDDENCDLRLCRIQLQISCRCKEIYICMHTHTHTHFHGDDLFYLCLYLNKNGWSGSSEKDKLGWEGVTLRNIRNLYYTTA